MSDDMDVDAGRILEGRGTLDEVAAQIVALVLGGSGPVGRRRVRPRGHQEFVLTYKSFEPTGPACLPLVATR